ncbi:hypothetical protein J3A83DRAFT_2038035 [Scleroderma citrinum]
MQPHSTPKSTLLDANYQPSYDEIVSNALPQRRVVIPVTFSSLPATVQSATAFIDQGVTAGGHGLHSSNNRNSLALQLKVNTRHLASHHKDGLVYPPNKLNSLSSPQCEYDNTTMDLSSPMKRPKHMTTKALPAFDFQVNHFTALGKHKAEELDGEDNNSTALKQMGLRGESAGVFLPQHRAQRNGFSTSFGNVKEGDLDDATTALGAFTNMPLSEGHAPTAATGSTNSSGYVSPTDPVESKSHASKSLEAFWNSLSDDQASSNSDNIREKAILTSDSASTTSSASVQRHRRNVTVDAKAIPTIRKSKQDKGKRPIRARLCPNDNGVASGSGKTLERMQSSSSTHSTDSGEDMDLSGHLDEWSKVLWQTFKKRDDLSAIFEDEPSYCPKLLEIAREIDSKKNWITMEEALKSRLAFCLRKVYYTCDAEVEGETVRVIARILDNFSQRFSGRRFPPST